MSHEEVARVIAQSQKLWEQGEVEKAFAVLDEGQATLPDVPEVPVARAQYLNGLERFGEALEACREALQRDPGNAEARFAQGFALLMQERLTEADAVLAALLAEVPAYPDAAWLRAGLLRKQRGDHAPEVLTAYDVALAADPANLYAQSERADVLRALGRYEEARDIYRALHSPDYCPDETLRLEAAFQLGSVSLVLQDMPTAREAFRRVLAIAPDYPDAQALYDLVAMG